MRGIVMMAFWAISTDPVLAQSVNKNLIQNLNFKLLYLALPLAIAVEVGLLYTVYRFRNNDDPKPTQQNHRLEITWTAAVALILLFVGVASMTVLANPYITPTLTGTPEQGTAENPQLQGAVEPVNESAVVIKVTAFKWGWEYEYRGENVTTQGKLVIPANRTVFLHLTSADLIHSFYSPRLGLKQDAFPSGYNTIRTKVTASGTYRYYCAEFCGAGHSRMSGMIVVLPNDEYKQWLEAQRESSENGTESQ